MAEKIKGAGRGLPAVIVLGTAAIVTGVAFYFVSRVSAAGAIALTAGANLVTYTGKDQYAGDAFASIIDHLVIAYRLDPETQEWEQAVTGTLMVSGEEYNITVSEDCIWTF